MKIYLAGHPGNPKLEKVNILKKKNNQRWLISFFSFLEKGSPRYKWTDILLRRTK